jgi:FkbM family methyltransferase
MNWSKYNRIHIDVGANDGKMALHYARYEPKTFVIAFEPVPVLAEKIKEESSHLNNFMLIEKGVGDYDGFANLNISAESPYADYGCSSILSFSDKANTEWSNRPDFRFIGATKIELVRLDTFIKDYGIPQIDYIKIDTQGYDLKVLESAGEFIKIIKEGVMEAGAKDDILYKGQNTQLESVSFLQAKGFEITNIESNDVHTNEVNIYFKNLYL